MDNTAIVGLFGNDDLLSSCSEDEYEATSSSVSPGSSSAPATPPSGVVGMLPPEDAEGNVEYKLKLVEPTESRFEHLVTQMKWRLREGQGEAIYEIGVEDCGTVVGLNPRELTASLKTIYRMAEKLDADVTILRQNHIRDNLIAAQILVRKVPDDQQTIELRIAVLGNVDAGKSTLLGVLTQGDLDNGRGRARLNLFRHLHEIQTGHTSSISREILGFNSNGQPLTYKHYRTAEEICDNSSKIITFIDLAGHQKFLKTTLFGLTGHSPHYVILVVPAVSGLTGTALDHLALVQALQVPVIVVVNKVDTVSKNRLLATLAQVEQLLRECRKIPMEILNQDDALTAAQNLDSGTVCPIFMTSCMTGIGLNLLYAFLNVLPTRHSVKERECLMQLSTFFQIDETFDVPDVGLVAGGLLTQGMIRENDVLLAGPDSFGEFQRVRVTSLQRNRVPCRMVRAGESATLALDVKRPQTIRKGTVLCSPSGRPVAGMLFQAHIRILCCDDEPIRVGFHTTVQVGNVQQGAVVAGIRGRAEMFADDTGLILFRFSRHPECISPGTRFVFHKGTTRGIGVVKKVYPLTPLETGV